MKTKKPDIFLGITMGMLVLAAVLCLTILVVQKSKNSKNPVPNGNPIGTGEALSNNTSHTDESNPGDTGSTSVDTNSTEPDATQPVNLAAIDDAGLKAALEDCLSGLPNDWQVVVMDPALDTRVDAVINSPNADDWMKADGMVPVFVMGAVFQQLADGTVTEDQVIADVRAMVAKGDGAATDRLTALLGGGDAAKGMEAVKTFATDNGLKLGYNRTMAGVGAKPNYVTALQMSLILNKICKGELVSKEASNQMLDILCAPRETELIDPGVEGENVTYGFVSYAEDKVSVASMGIVRLPHRSYVISVVCNGPNNLDNAKAKVTQLLKLTQPFFAD